MPSTPQLNLITPEDIWARSLLAKIEGLVDYSIYENLKRCGQEEFYRTCRDCGNWDRLYYRCSIKFCPRCNWRIARERAKLLQLWTFQIKQPKHVVLTMKNFEVLTRRSIRKFQKAFAKFRRTKLWSEVKGGCVSTEITNEGNGWHLHAHILADVRWLPADLLAIEWGKAVGQQFGIVKVKDARGKEYLGEVTKYVVKPAQLVSWDVEHIAEFIHAIKGVRFFATFGSMFAIRKEMKKVLDATKPPPKPCECGSLNCYYESETADVVNSARSHGKYRG